MYVTIIKRNSKDEIAVTATQRVLTLEQLVMFASQLGYTQRVDEFRFDFEVNQDITYFVGLENEATFH